MLRHSQPIVNVVPGDFTQSGRLDLLVMSRSPSSKSQLDLFLYRASPDEGLGEVLDYPMLNRRFLTALIETTPLSLPPSSESQPIPFDSTGDLRIDLLGISPSSGDQESFSIWQNVWNASLPNSPLYELCVRHQACYSRLSTDSFPRTRTTLEGLQCKPANPHSHAVVDLDGDCLAGG